MIGLMDCNNFFVSCERLFRPDLLRRPVMVLSSNDGCVVARSQEVKDLGILMGVPLFQVIDVCKEHNVVLFSSNFKLYRDISRRVMHALREEFARCEVYSIDEAFFEVSQEYVEEDIVAIRARIMQKTGIPVSIGIARTKTLAKIASSVAKKGGGVCYMNDLLCNNTLTQLSCGNVWGIGRQTSTKLTRMGVHTISDLLALDVSYIRSHFGVVGERLYMELKGVSVYPIDTRVGIPQESYTSTRSFGRSVRDMLTLKSALGYHIGHVAEKLREDGMVASTIVIEMNGSRFGTDAHPNGLVRTTLHTATDDTFILTREVSRMVEKIYNPKILYKKAGVTVRGIQPKACVPTSLFVEEIMTERTGVLSGLVDTLNTRFGKGAVRQAITLGADKWKEHQTYISPNYTTSWSEIPYIKAT